MMDLVSRQDKYGVLEYMGTYWAEVRWLFDEMRSRIPNGWQLYMYVTCFGLPKTSESIKFLISIRVYSYTFSEFKFHSCDFLGVGGFDPPFCTVRPFVSTLFNIEAASLQELIVFLTHSMLCLPVALTIKSDSRRIITMSSTLLPLTFWQRCLDLPCTLPWTTPSDLTQRS